MTALTPAEAQARLAALVADAPCLYPNVNHAGSCESYARHPECAVAAVLAAPELLRAATGGRVVRDGDFPNFKPMTMVSCSHCGAHPTNRWGWCDLGCGNDFNQLSGVAVWSFPVPADRGVACADSSLAAWGAHLPADTDTESGATT